MTLQSPFEQAIPVLPQAHTVRTAEEDLADLRLSLSSNGAKRADENMEDHFKRIFEYVRRLEAHGHGPRASTLNQILDYKLFRAWADVKYEMFEKPTPLSFPELTEEAKNVVRKRYLREDGVPTYTMTDAIRPKFNALGYSGNLYHHLGSEVEEKDRYLYMDGVSRRKDLVRLATRLLPERDAWYIRKLVVAGWNARVVFDRGHGGDGPMKLIVLAKFDNPSGRSRPKLTALFKRLEKAVKKDLAVLTASLVDEARTYILEEESSERIDPRIMEYDRKYTAAGERYGSVKAEHRTYRCFSNTYGDYSSPFWV